MPVYRTANNTYAKQHYHNGVTTHIGTIQNTASYGLSIQSRVLPQKVGPQREAVPRIYFYEETPAPPVEPFDWLIQHADIILNEPFAEGGLAFISVVPTVVVPPMDWYVNDRDGAAEAEPSPTPQLAFIEYPISAAAFVPLDWYVVGDPFVLDLSSPVSQLAYVDVVAAAVITTIAPPVSTQVV